MEKSVIKFGDKRLNEKSAVVDDFSSSHLKTVIADLKDTKLAIGGVGLVAPQIGVNMRVGIFEAPEGRIEIGKTPIPLTVIINPKLKPVGTEMERGWESCLSYPDLEVEVPRYKAVTMLYCDELGGERKLSADGFVARLLQHECDHLDGILHISRIDDSCKIRVYDTKKELPKEEAQAVLDAFCS